MIALKPISLFDVNAKECGDLLTTKEQEKFVSPNVYSLAQAYHLNRKGIKSCAMPYAIYANDKMVGFVMYGFFEPSFDDDCKAGEDHYYFWRFMFDKNEQNKGYGREAMRQVIEEVRKMPKGRARHFYTSVEPENVVATRLYESFSFKKTGEIMDGEEIMRLELE